MSDVAVSTLKPIRTDPDTGGFWEAADRGELVVRSCTDCGAVIHLPKTYCHYCASWNTTWKTVAPAGHLFSYTQVEHTVHPAYPAPYAIVLVELDEAPSARLTGMIAGRPELTIGQPMVAVFDADADGVVIPQWAASPAS
jgi:uncharacterized OB-fold protein